MEDVLNNINKNPNPIEYSIADYIIVHSFFFVFPLLTINPPHLLISTQDSYTSLLILTPSLWFKSSSTEKKK